MQQQTLTENHLSGRLLTLSVLCGLAAGLMAVAYRFALSQAELLWAAAVDFARAHGAPGVAGWFLVLAALSLCVRQLLRLEPLISGSGIPQFEGEVTGQLHARWLRVLLCKALGGILCVFGGLSLGREGPSVQLGAMAAKGIAGAGKFGRQHQHLLITCGASAGLAAAFNAPLAGVLFALEEVHKTFSPAMLISAMTAATVADCVSKFFFGTATVFSFPLAVPLSLRYYGLVILIGLLTGAAGGLYNHCTLGAMKVCGRVPERVRMLLPFCAAGLLGFTLPQVLGGGHRMIELLNQGSL
ncbi:MAG: chloride channel protein, partial [Oscillospiraceae bacterium]